MYKWMLHSDQINIADSKTHSDDENKANFILVKNRKNFIL